MDEAKQEIAGFGSRLFAHLIDIVVLFPVLLLFGKLIQRSRGAAMLGAVAYGLLFPLYNIFLLGLFGQTVGKKAVGIRVDLVDNSALTWKAAFLRHSVDLFFACILIAGWMSVLFDPRLGPLVNVKYYTLLKPANVFFIWVGRLWAIWFWSELVVMLLNTRRRALHDFIAGTWVIQTRLLPRSIAMS